MTFPGRGERVQQRESGAYGGVLSEFQGGDSEIQDVE